MDSVSSDDSPRNLSPKPVWIYALIDPRSNEIRYIGKSVSPRKRLDAHLRGSKESNKHKLNWLRGLTSSGMKPIMQIIEVATSETWVERECYWIAYYREQGCRLLNISEGGSGGSGYPRSEEHKRKVGDRFRGKKQSPEHVEKRAVQHRGMKRPADGVERSAAKHRGKKQSQDVVEKRIAPIRGIKRPPFSEEHRHNISEAAKQRKSTPETNAKISAANKGRKQSPEWVAKRAAARRGTHHSPEARAKMSAAAKARRKRNVPLAPSLWD